MKRAQLFTMELMVVSSIFLMLVASSLVFWNSYTFDKSDSDLHKDLQTKAFSAADLLVRKTIADEPNVVSLTKTDELLDMTYEDARKYLSIQPYDFYLKLSCFSAVTENVSISSTFSTIPTASIASLSNPGSGSPDLSLEKTIRPNSVTLGDITYINLSVMGIGVSNVTHPVDVVLIMDRSGSMAGSKITDAKNAAKGFLDKLNSSEDKAALVSFTYGGTNCDNRNIGCYAMINQNLTTNFTKVKNAITALTASGNTAIGEGIKNSTNELVRNSRSNATKIAILLSDGLNNRGTDPMTQAINASKKGIKIYTIGLGNDTNVTLMKLIANTTGGKYYFAPNSSDLDDIYEKIAKEITDIAAKNVIATDYLHPGIMPVTPLPDGCVSQLLSDKSTKISCTIPEDVNINETFSFVIEAKVMNSTINSTNIMSYVNFTNYKDLNKSKFFTDPLIAVKAMQHCSDFSEKTLGIEPANNSEVVVARRIGSTDSGTVFIDLFVWSESHG